MCWRRSFNFLLLVAVASGAYVGKNENNDAIGGFYPNKRSINEGEIDQESLDSFDEATSKIKRETNDYSDDQIAEEIEEDEDQREENYRIRSTMQQVKLPKKVGTPSFKIHAEKVYILYPSMFQDPNIFGRFSIPQSVNLNQSPTKSLMQADETADSTDNEQTSIEGLQSGRRMTRRQATNSPARLPAKKDESKKNVETHLTGSIVVLNQDVNEINANPAY